MNAIPKIELRAAVRPTYDNRNMRYGALWIRDNEVALQGYYAELGGRLPNSGSANATAEFTHAQKYVAWACMQWDIERLRA